MWSLIAVRSASAVLKLRPQLFASSHRLIRSGRPPASLPLEERHDQPVSLTREVEEEQRLDLIPQLSGRERRLAATLFAYAFTPEHVKKIIEHFRYKTSLYEFEPAVVRESVKFWLKNVHPDKVRTI